MERDQKLYARSAGTESKEVSMCNHDHDGPDWMDIGLAGALAEEMAEEEKERERIRKEMEKDLEQDGKEDDDPLK
jgi:hypothetical protein